MEFAGRAPERRPSPLRDALPSVGPAADVSHHDLYGSLSGDWDVDVTDYLPDGTRRQGTGEWHFGWVLQGRALQDVWIAPRRGERPPPGETPDRWNRYGVSIRFYDPAIDAWRVTWVNPVQNYVATLVGRASGRDIVQEGSGDEGVPLRWTFSEITPDGFRWRGEMSVDGGRTWRIVQEMSARRATQQGPVPSAPSARMMDALLADGPAFGGARGLDLFGQFAGSWEGTLSGTNTDGSRITGPGEIHVDWVLEGRAIQDVWIYPKRGTEPGASLADEYGSTIRFRHPSSDVWRIVWVSPVTRTVRVYEGRAAYRGRAEPDDIVIAGTDPHGRRQRWIFSRITPSSFHFRNDVSDDDGSTWQVVEQVDARRVAATPASR